MNTIDYSVDTQGIARVTLTRPDKHNALNPEMMHELIDAFARIGADPSIRAVVLGAEGQSFCAGGDLQWMQSNLEKSREARHRESRILARLFGAVDHCPKLVIGRINGSAYGGGVGLVAVCDISIGVRQASFALTEVRLGLVPANIAPYVLRRLGAANLRQVALNAAPFDADRAAELGLLSQVVSAEMLDQAVQLQLDLALACAPGAIATTKQLIANLERGELEDETERLVEILGETWEGQEAQAGIRAFFDRRQPPWKPVA